MDAILKILPFAIGAAVSPLILTFSILIISSPKQGVKKAWVYTLGNAICIMAIGAAIILLNLGAKKVATKPSLVDVGFALFAGIVLVLFALKRLLTKPKKKAKKPNTKTGLGGYFALGLVTMLSNTSTIIMFFPAAAILAESSATSLAKLYGLVTMVVFSLIPSLVAPLSAVLLGKRSKVVLEPLGRFVTKYGRVLVGVLFGLIGLYLIYKAVIDITRIYS